MSVLQKLRARRAVRKLQKALRPQKPSWIAKIEKMGPAASGVVPDLMKEIEEMVDNKELIWQSNRMICFLLRRAILNVGGDEGKEAIDKYVSRLLDMPPVPHIVEALGVLGSNDIVPNLQEIMTSTEDTDIAQSATIALWLIGTEEAAKALLDSYDMLWQLDKKSNTSPYWCTMKCAAALGMMRYRPAASKLKQNLLDPEHIGLFDSVAQVARSLKQILGQDADSEFQDILSRIPDTMEDGNPKYRGSAADNSSRSKREAISNGFGRKESNMCMGEKSLIR